MNETAPVASAFPRHPGRMLLLLGMFTAVAGVAIYMLQFTSGILTTPWYMPGMATVGVGFIILSIRQSRSIGRWLALMVFTLFAGFQWFAFLVMMKIPEYAGPAKAGTAFPTFTASLADGSPFSQENLKGDKNAIMLFFRGRW